MVKVKWVTLLLLCFVGLNANSTIKILAIGNSFSEDATETYLVGMAIAGGHKMIVGNAVIGGATLEMHWNNANTDSPAYSYRKVNAQAVKTKTTTEGVTLLSILQDEDWDYITFQQASALSGMYDTYFPYLTNLYNYAKLHAVNPNVQYAMHMTWAYAGNSTHSGFDNYGKNQLTMYNAIVDVVRRAANEVDIEIVIPTGTAIQNGRTSMIGDNFCRDGYHLNTLGRYIAACSWYEKLLGESVIGNSFTHSGVSAAQREIAQKAAHYAVLNPYSVSELGSTQASVILTMLW